MGPMAGATLLVLPPPPPAALRLTAGAANDYLADNTFRDLGVSVLAEIETMTTYAPQDGGRPDSTGTDLGYHYPVNEDSDYDGLPDWWEYFWFGDYAHGQRIGRQWQHALVRLSKRAET